MTSPTLSTIRLDIAGGAARITLDRPQRKNAINFTMIEEMYRTLETLSARADICVVVLAGSAGWFCPGGDVQAVVNGEAAAEIARGVDFQHFRVPALLREMPQLTIAAVNGPCAAAGLGWALACDLRYATRSAKFATAFLERGIAGDMAVPWTLSRIVGPARARELSFLCSRIDAARAAEIGLVSDVFEDEQFERDFAKVVDRILSFNAATVRALKANYLLAESTSLADFCDHETVTVADSVYEQIDRFRSFLDRDRPAPPST